ncbi:hypothetical protein ACFL1K_00970 [Candidatus Omnitrophota bacterium]
MRSKQSLRNSARSALLFFSLFALLSLAGCEYRIEPTYKEKDIPHIIKNICQDEFDLEVITKRTHNTLWVYAPMAKILHEEYGLKEDKFFDEGMSEKLRNILMTFGRVLLSSDNAPEFYAILASDINLGIDYTMIGYLLDLKKSYAQAIHWMEANRRYVIKLDVAPDAIADTTGEHLKAFDIKFADFLAEQIGQRIGAKFQDENWKNYFLVEKTEGRFSEGVFSIEYSISPLAPLQQEIDIKEEILNIATYCIRTYGFEDFSRVELTDLQSGDLLILGKDAIMKRPMP